MFTVEKYNFRRLVFSDVLNNLGKNIDTATATATANNSSNNNNKSSSNNQSPPPYSGEKSMKFFLMISYNKLL
jgi:hypothetical protein